jgi:phosphoribosylamine-glycine ligase
VLYAGLMIGPKGLFVLEFNARFGDPETEAVLPRIGGTSFPRSKPASTARSPTSRAGPPEAAATVILPPEVIRAPTAGPAHLRAGLGRRRADAIVFHAGTALKDGQAVTAGGRVLAVTALGSDLRAAVGRAYEAAAKIHFDGVHYRTDIAHRALDRA